MHGNNNQQLLTVVLVHLADKAESSIAAIINLKITPICKCQYIVSSGEKN